MVERVRCVFRLGVVAGRPGLAPWACVCPHLWCSRLRWRRVWVVGKGECVRPSPGGVELRGLPVACSQGSLRHRQPACARNGRRGVRALCCLARRCGVGGPTARRRRARTLWLESQSYLSRSCSICLRTSGGSAARERGDFFRRGVEVGRPRWCLDAAQRAMARASATSGGLGVDSRRK